MADIRGLVISKFRQQDSRRAQSWNKNNRDMVSGLLLNRDVTSTKGWTSKASNHSGGLMRSHRTKENN